MWRSLVFTLPILVLVGAGCLAGNMTGGRDTVQTPRAASGAEENHIAEVEIIHEPDSAAMPMATITDITVHERSADGSGAQGFETQVVAPHKTVDLKSGNFFFEPAIISVKAGDIVNVNVVDNSGFHTFVIDEIGVKQQLADGQSFTFEAPSEPGDYAYYCDVGSHRELGMEGVLRVE